MQNLFRSKQSNIIFKAHLCYRNRHSVPGTHLGQGSWLITR